MSDGSAASGLTLAEFNRADVGTATQLLGAVLDIDEYVGEVTAGRPFPDLAALQIASASAAARISWPQVAGALARHPRIGQKPAGESMDASWSAGEQAGVAAEQIDDFAAGNAAYERRFGFIFLICAAGLSGDEMLTALRQRMAHSLEQEQPVVIGQLQQIAALRLKKAVSA